MSWADDTARELYYKLKADEWRDVPLIAAALRKAVEDKDKEIERLRQGLRSQAIAGTKCWFYAPCSKCGAIEGMGLTSPRTGATAVWCCYCDHMGPEAEGISEATDRTVVQRWNREFHEAFKTVADHQKPKKVRVGDSCLTRDLVWCECGRGLSLHGTWLYCPKCGGALDQESYCSAVATARANGASLFYRDADAIEWVKQAVEDDRQRILGHVQSYNGANWRKDIAARIRGGE